MYAALVLLQCLLHRSPPGVDRYPPDRVGVVVVMGGPECLGELVEVDQDATGSVSPTGLGALTRAGRTSDHGEQRKPPGTQLGPDRDWGRVRGLDDVGPTYAG